MAEASLQMRDERVGRAVSGFGSGAGTSTADCPVVLSARWRLFSTRIFAPRPSSLNQNPRCPIGGCTVLRALQRAAVTQCLYCTSQVPSAAKEAP
jgi:hypothetical protein